MTEQLFAIDMNQTIMVDALTFAKGEVLISAHRCRVPDHDHKDEVIPVLAIVVKDTENKQHTLIFPVDSSITRAFTDMDIYHYVKSLVEVDN